MSKYKCIIFDCDGVLVDSEPLSNAVMVDMANALGANIDIKYAYQHFKGNSMQKCMELISNLTQKILPDNFEETYRQRSFEKFKTEIKPIEGVVELIKNLKIPFCVASSGPEHKIKFNLELTHLLPYFKDQIFSCYTIEKWKPDPAIFLWAAETMGFNPNECLVIEDSPIGVQAAINGGFDVYGYTKHDYNNELKKIATNVFNDMLKLPHLI